MRHAYAARLPGWSLQPTLETRVRGGRAAAWRAGSRVLAIALVPRPLYHRPTPNQALLVFRGGR